MVDVAGGAPGNEAGVGGHGTISGAGARSASVVISSLPITSFAMFAARASVALRTILEVRDAFPDMLGSDGIWLMLVASEASVPVGVIVDMAGRASGRVRAFEKEKLRVVEMIWLPTILAVALPAIRARAAVNRGVGRRVARLAFRAIRRQQQRV